MNILSGWWFGTFFIFPYIEENPSHWLIFFRGVETTNQLLMHPFFFAGHQSLWSLPPKLWIPSGNPHQLEDIAGDASNPTKDRQFGTILVWLYCSLLLGVVNVFYIYIHLSLSIYIYIQNAYIVWVYNLNRYTHTRRHTHTHIVSEYSV